MIIHNYFRSSVLTKYLNHTVINTFVGLLLFILIMLRIEHHVIPLWLSIEPTDAAMPVLPENKKNAREPDIPGLEQLNLFSSKSINSYPSPFRVGNLSYDDPLLFQAPNSKLAVSLVGILSSTVREKSIAIIEKNKRQQSYSQGDKLPENHAEVVKIFGDRVIINHQGNYESLLLN
ncbi:type II secretion system protein N [Yersinia ruckeri]|uniref:type II secretion system protein N n=1 Tax=Yersinia ruckeri TaxID=29486 RepID=UPI001E51C715|nr:type II secretion system protein N [Yersinia ruckeri]MCK8596447.1 general secretion pathway protein GspC [Yersinia ruckeri]MCW6605287.1 general secretion pathway protein GspC [Yersinia ruckeri]MCW6612103.1 general secretion pathway protein GspC [Yersinia ruckeri]MCW6618699.1 general secretion pathway protein GspC [Yersinia ruckeri]MCW6632111.1 general secretion pathway protein GspC [Yersinia ruckeri]